MPPPTPPPTPHPGVVTFPLPPAMPRRRRRCVARCRERGTISRRNDLNLNTMEYNHALSSPSPSPHFLAAAAACATRAILHHQILNTTRAVCAAAAKSRPFTARLFSRRGSPGSTAFPPQCPRITSLPPCCRLAAASPDSSWPKPLGNAFLFPMSETRFTLLPGRRGLYAFFLPFFSAPPPLSAPEGLGWGGCNVKVGRYSTKMVKVP